MGFLASNLYIILYNYLGNNKSVAKIDCSGKALALKRNKNKV